MFRRPVSRELEETFVRFANERIDRGVEFPEAVRGAAKAALCSPHFFMLLSKPGPLDDHALASRLSYFLWKSLPDDALLEVAARGELHQPEVLREQVERMLKDARSQRFVKDFVGQWLQVNKALTMKPDDAYPEYYDTALGMSLMPETELFFAEMLAKHRELSACASCHSQIDPPGFALENYEVIGGYRTHYRSGDGPGYRHLPNYPEIKEVWFGSEVTSSAVTAGGDSFRDLDDFKELLLRDPDQLARNVIRKLLGTRPEPTFNSLIGK